MNTTNYESTSIFVSIKKHFLIIIAIAGIIWSIIFSFATGTERKSPSHSISTPPIAPFEHNIAGIGFVESSSRNINIGSFAPGIVSEVMVNEDNKVNKDDVLFILDQRSAIAKIQNANNALEVSKASLVLSQIALEDAKDDLSRAEGLKSGRSISAESLQNRRFDVKRAKADIIIKKHMIAQSETTLQIAEIELEKTIIKSPISGTVLKVRISPGEFINSNETENNSPMLIGKTHPLHVRTQIDENDIWRFNKELKAYAFLRSNNEIKLTLSFVRIEPYASGKESIRGIGSELVDTRVIEIIYKIDSEVENLYIGQQLDVFIKSASSP